MAKSRKGGVRRRVSAVTKNSPLMMIFGAVGGAVVSRLVYKYIPITDPKIKALIPFGLGVAMIMMKKSPPIVKGAGYGMVGASIPTLAEALIPGVMGPDSLMGGEDADLEIFNMRQLNGPADMSVLAGPDGYYSDMNGPADQSVLAGPEEDDGMEGYEEYYND